MAANRYGMTATLLLMAAFTIGVLLQDPIAQSLDYHEFKDNRTLLSIPNFFNVISNFAFVIVGAMGLYSLLFSNRIVILVQLQVGYVLLFLGVLLVGLGSGYYHWSPNNHTLVWDRLPMTLAFMALSAIIVGEYVAVDLARRLLFPLSLGATAAVFYWHYTESNGAGDLRFYILVQFLPLIALPLILLFKKPAFSHGNSYWWLLLSYVLAKLLEHFDRDVFNLLSIISGHTLKHLMAALGLLLLLNGYKKRHRVNGN